MKIALERATQERISENPTKIRNKWKKHSKELWCNRGSIINGFFFSLKWWKQYSLKNLFILFYTEGTALLWMSMCDGCIDNQLLTDNKTLLLKKIYVYFQDFLDWNVVIAHQYPIGCCALSNFLRVSCNVHKQHWRCRIFRKNYSRQDKKDYRFHGLQNTLRWNYMMNFSSLTSRQMNYTLIVYFEQSLALLGLNQYY